jgi:prephenate dehydrogenase
VDADGTTERRAMEIGAINTIGTDAGAEICFVATPVGRVAEIASAALEAGHGVVTDVGSVKTRVTDVVDSERFVGGHPMAGSEQEGIEGADPDMFSGAVWVLTPTHKTEETAFALVSEVVTSLGADVVALDPQTHDRVVAVVSHVPHLAAATLMGLAAEHGTEHAALLRLAAGGFRDMTRIAAGHPGIWPDICGENADAIVDVLDGFMSSLARLRTAVAEGDRESLLATLTDARAARLNLPSSATRPDELVEIRVRVPDRPGQVARITAIATELGANIYDLEIAHSVEGDQGVLIMLADRHSIGGLSERLGNDGYPVNVRELS